MRKYKQKNDAEIKIRLPQSLKDDFLHCCDLLDAPVAEVIRVMMSDFLKDNQSFINSSGEWGAENLAKKIINKKKREEKLLADIPLKEEKIELNTSTFDHIDEFESDNFQFIDISTDPFFEKKQTPMNKVEQYKAQRQSKNSQKRKKKKKR